MHSTLRDVRGPVESLPGREPPRTPLAELWMSLLSVLLNTKTIPTPGNYLVRSESRWAFSGAAIFKITVTLSLKVEQVPPPTAIAVRRVFRAG
jgi:hypothetical protein